MSGPNPAEFRLERPLSRAEFRAAARLGLGRAILHLRTFGSGGLKKTVEHLVLRWHGYDSQIEDFRGSYLIRLARAAGVWERLRPVVLHRMWTAARRMDRAQAVSIAVLLRDEESRRAIVRAGMEGVANDYAVEPVDVFRAGGVAAVEAVVAERARRAERGGEWSYLAQYESVARRAGDPALAARWWGVFDHGEDPISSGEPSQQPGRPPPSDRLDAIFKAVERGPSSYSSGNPCIALFSRWGVKLSTSEVQAILDRLAVETDRHRTLRLLWVRGWKREFPRAPQVLLDLARHGNGRVRAAALNALRSTTDPRVAELGRELIGRPHANRAVQLLSFGFTSADEPVLVEEVLRRHRKREGWVYGDFDLIIAKHPEHGFGTLLPELYRRADCGHCRGRVFEQMLRRGAVPRALLEEAAWDSYRDTRAMARRALRTM